MRKYTIAQFNKDFPTDDACLEWLRNHLYPKLIDCPICGRPTKHHRIKTRKVYGCDNCGHQISPTAGTIFHKSPTPLKLWFHAIFLISSTRCGISAKQIERETGVTYKTAWRMAKQIRQFLLTQTDKPLGGGNGVELDETYVGAKLSNMHKAKRDRINGRGTAGKFPIFGAVERKGEVLALAVSNTDGETLTPHIQKHIIPTSTIYTDDMGAYKALADKGYKHLKINHIDKVYVNGNIHTNTIEGFWSLVKRGISGVYHAVSKKYLQEYVNEYTFRYNHRKDEKPMFLTVLGKVRTS